MNVGDEPLEQVEQIGFGPVNVLDHENAGRRRRELLDETDRRHVQSLACVERMESGAVSRPSASPRISRAGELAR